MNPGPDHDRLLSDVLGEDAPAGFREALLGETLRRVRRRRHQRRAGLVGAVFAVAGLIALLAWRVLPPPSGLPTVSTPGRGYELVLTQPLPAAATVTTRPQAADRLISSQPTVAVISTTRGGSFQVIDDGQLLALVAPRPAALVRIGPGNELLVFANPDDERGFPLN